MGERKILVSREAQQEEEGQGEKKMKGKKRRRKKRKKKDEKKEYCKSSTRVSSAGNMPREEAMWP
eukprot:1946257-Rhodomonas_salina.3